MPKIYVVNNSGHDFSAAEEYGGPLVFLSSGMMPRYNINQMYREFANILQHSGPEDYILCTSLTQMNMIAAAIMTYLHGKVNLLIHNRDRYVARQIDVGSLLSSNLFPDGRHETDHSETGRAEGGD